jgi:hypothetical protein
MKTEWGGGVKPTFEPLPVAGEAVVGVSHPSSRLRVWRVSPGAVTVDKRSKVLKAGPAAVWRKKRQHLPLISFRLLVIVSSGKQPPSSLARPTHRAASFAHCCPPANTP